MEFILVDLSKGSIGLIPSHNYYNYAHNRILSSATLESLSFIIIDIDNIVTKNRIKGS